MLAWILDRFRVPPDQLSDLTDRQIHELYFHKRDRDGKITWPEDPADDDEDVPSTLSEEIAKLQMMRQLFGLSQERYDEIVAELTSRYEEADRANQASEQVPVSYPFPTPAGG